MKKVLLTWDAFNNGFIVTAKTIKLLQDNHKIKINEIVYLQNQNLSELNKAEIDVFYNRKSYKDVLEQFKENKAVSRIKECKNISEEYQLEGKLPRFSNERITIKSVTHYQSIYDNLAKFIKVKFLDNDNEIQLHINVSPGTPQMHVVWLMLNASGFLPYNTILWSSQWDKKKQTTRLEKINFKPKTFLSEVLKKKYLNNALPKINPNETKSILRQEAENKILIYSKIPNAPILLLGERGIGKSTYVRTIIKNSYADTLPYSELACGTFSDDLMRAELFGYKKGAFTGANTDKKGILSLFKEGGLLFLDEIQDLSKPLQRQLMQVLQTGEFLPVGATEVEKTNFRLIAASNLTLAELVKSKLDMDFFDRISRYMVEIPPLRLCKEDIKQDWEKVWKEVANFENAPPLIYNDKIHQFLMSQELKGNFRDLQKLASLIIAFFYQTHNHSKAIETAILEFSKWKDRLNESHAEKYFISGKTYNEIIAEFNKDLAQWAIKEYGSRKNAAEKLDRSESMLSKDLKMDRLTKSSSKNIKA